MSDRLQFRVFYKPDGTMVDWSTLKQTAWNTEKCSMIYDLFTEWKYSDDYEIMQSTGRKDKNKRLIFEKDVYELKVHGIETHVEFIDCVVKWNESMCAFGWNRLTKESEQPLWINMNANILDMKHLGDVHQNPELLKV